MSRVKILFVIGVIRNLGDKLELSKDKNQVKEVFAWSKDLIELYSI